MTQDAVERQNTDPEKESKTIQLPETRLSVTRTKASQILKMAKNIPISQRSKKIWMAHLILQPSNLLWL